MSFVDQYCYFMNISNQNQRPDLTSLSVEYSDKLNWRLGSNLRCGHLRSGGGILSGDDFIRSSHSFGCWLRCCWWFWRGQCNKFGLYSRIRIKILCFELIF